MDKHQEEDNSVSKSGGYNPPPRTDTAPTTPSRKSTQEISPMPPAGGSNTAARVVNEGLVSLARVASKLQVHSRTVARWCLTGVAGVDGQVHKLECARIGRKLRTSWPAVSRFLAAMQQAREASLVASASKTLRDIGP